MSALPNRIRNLFGGLAYGRKMKVIACIYSTFLQRAFDNFFHDVCLQHNASGVRNRSAGLSGGDGSTASWTLRHRLFQRMPNMIISQPRDGQLLKELLESSFSWQRPTAIRYPNIATEESSEPLQYRPVGVGEVLTQGNDLLIISLGHMNSMASKINALLSLQGITATLMDPIFIKPLDAELLCGLLLKHNKIVTLEEHSVVSGMGSIINHFLLTNGYNHIEVLNFGIPESFIEHGSTHELLDEIGLTPEKISGRILSHFFPAYNCQIPTIVPVK